MNTEGTRDLAWWQIPSWVPAWPRALATAFVYVLIVGLMNGLTSWLKYDGIMDLFVNDFMSRLLTCLGFAVTVGVLVGLVARTEPIYRRLGQLRWSKRADRKDLMLGLGAGFVAGLAAGLLGLVGEYLRENFVDARGALTIMGGNLVMGLILGFLLGLTGGLGRRPPRHWAKPRWSGIRKNLIDGLAGGVAIGLLFGLGAGLVNGLLDYYLMATNCVHGAREDGSLSASCLSPSIGTIVSDVTGGTIGGIAFGALVGLLVGLAAGLGRPSTQASSPVDPWISWRRNRQFAIAAGLTFGLPFMLAGLIEFLFGLAKGLVGLQDVLPDELDLLTFWLQFGLAALLASSATWPAMLASVQLWRRGEAPIRLLRFLEDARDRQVLRTVGQVYQFRHGQLQDRLACTD